MLKDQLNKARKEGYALGQFNFCTLEQLQGIVAASEETSVPLICGTSGGEVKFMGVREAAALLGIMRERTGASVFLNLDHGRDIDLIKEAVDCGYDGVHFDGSHLPLEENIRLTKEVVSYAHEKGVFVEGEVGKVKGKSIPHASEIEEVILTSMEKIVRFIKETGVDSIALDVGSVHGIYSHAPSIEFKRISETKETGCFVVLHGGSGIEEEDIKESIRRGVVKININTELRIVWRDAIYGKMDKDKEEVVPYNILPLAREATKEKVKNLINLFKS